VGAAAAVAADTGSLDFDSYVARYSGSFYTATEHGTKRAKPGEGWPETTRPSVPSRSYIFANDCYGSNRCHFPLHQAKHDDVDRIRNTL
jgi:hypothetical protein